MAKRNKLDYTKPQNDVINDDNICEIASKYSKREVAAIILNGILSVCKRGEEAKTKFETIMNIVRVANGKSIKPKDTETEYEQDIDFL